MKEIVITADSTCDLPQELVEKNSVIITPLSILLGENEHKDGVDIFPQGIYEYVDKNGDLPKTAAVTPAYYTELFERLTSEGKAVLHIGLSSGISSSFQNASIAASEFDDVYCVDSKNLCTAMGLLVLKACDLREKGFDVKQIYNRIVGLVPKVSSSFVLNDLEYLHKGGRCSGVAKFGANVLGIKPSIAVNSEGKLDVAKKYRGRMNAVYRQYTNDCLKAADEVDSARIVIANSGGVDRGIIDYAREQIAALGKFDEIIEAKAGCTISSHCGPKTFAIFYINE